MAIKTRSEPIFYYMVTTTNKFEDSDTSDGLMTPPQSVNMPKLTQTNFGGKSVIVQVMVSEESNSQRLFNGQNVNWSLLWYLAITTLKDSPLLTHQAVLEHALVDAGSINCLASFTTNGFVTSNMAALLPIS